jgi:hypothetical protein
MYGHVSPEMGICPEMSVTRGFHHLIIEWTYTNPDDQSATHWALL